MSENRIISVPMIFERSTPGTHVYKSHAEGTAITALYIKKTGLQGTPPDHITVTVIVNVDTGA